MQINSESAWPRTCNISPAAAKPAIRTLAAAMPDMQPRHTDTASQSLQASSADHKTTQCWGYACAGRRLHATGHASSSSSARVSSSPSGSPFESTSMRERKRTVRRGAIRLHDSLDFVLWQSQIFRDGFDQLRFVHTIEVLRVIIFVGKVKLIFFFETANIWDTFYDLRAAKAYTQKSRQNIWWNRKSVILLHSERWQSGRSRRS